LACCWSRHCGSPRASPKRNRVPGVPPPRAPDGAFVIALQKDADAGAAMTVLRGHADLVAGVDQGS